MDQNKVLAVVNDREITQQDVFAFLNELGPQVAMQFQSPEGIRQIADELANQELLYLDAIENGFDEEEDFKLEMEKVKANVLKQYAMHKLLSDISASEDEIKKYYDDHKEYFKTPEAVKAGHILVKEEEEANKILKEIEEGLSFEDAASKYSMCPSKEKGGDLGEFSRGSMVPEFEEAAFNMEPGKISEPVSTQFGYHLIRVEHKREESINAFEDVKDRVTEQVIGLKQQETYLNKTKELKEKYEVKTFY